MKKITKNALNNVVGGMIRRDMSVCAGLGPDCWGVLIMDL